MQKGLSLPMIVNMKVTPWLFDLRTIVSYSRKTQIKKGKNTMKKRKIYNPLLATLLLCGLSYDALAAENTSTTPIQEGSSDVTGPATFRMAEVVAEEEKEEGEMSIEQIAELMANPFSYLWFAMVQNDTYWWDGDLLDITNEDRKVMNTTVLQPVMAMQLTEEWKMIFRPVIPIHSFNTVTGFDIIEDEPEGPIGSNWDRKNGLGDIVLWTAFTNSYNPPFVWGFGPTIMMDTASNDALGTGKWSAGPMAMVANITDKWILGGIAQHWWSFAGSSNRDSVSLTDFQPIVRYRLSPQTNIGFAPNIQYNHTAKSGNRLRLPIGGGISTVVKLGKLPIAIGVEYYYMVETPDTFGPKHQFRFVITPVVPSPDWSRNPLF